MKCGPQGEPLLTDEELRKLPRYLKRALFRDVSADGPGFAIPRPRPDSAVAAGTDCEHAAMELAEGPQGEILNPSHWGDTCPCPLCGQTWGETCSEDGGQVSDPEVSLRRRQVLSTWQNLHDAFNMDDDDDLDWDDEDLRENIMTLFCDTRARKLKAIEMVS